MRSASVLKQKIFNSPLASHSVIQPHNRRGKKSITASLLLTSLVDAFSILVIFLMMNSASEQSDITHDKNIILPKSSQADITYKTTALKIVQNQIFLNDERIDPDKLFSVLTGIHEQNKAAAQTSGQTSSSNVDSLVIIADKDMNFATLNPILVLGSRAGFSELKFAVEKSSQE
ncbi:MAG: biopolymer transporter ExbD [Bdellovibrionales bacterium]|nr:biopolymer transporter ExbD [Bdellovibrionales bacterium]